MVTGRVEEIVGEGREEIAEEVVAEFVAEEASVGEVDE